MKVFLKESLIAILIVFTFFSVFLPLKCEAKGLVNGTGKDAINYYKNETNIRFAVDTASNDESSIKHAKKIIGAIIDVIQVLGLLIAVIMLMVLGIKYMTSSISEKAQIKEHLAWYVAGALIMFGASGIVTIIKIFVLGNTKNIDV